MRTNFLKTPSGVIICSAVMASVLLAASPLAVSAHGASVQAVRQNVIKGRVVDVGGEAVIGASVMLKGTTTGVITDLDGNFSLNNVRAGQVIVVSYIGCKTQEIKITADNRPLNIVLQEDRAVLDEVVVVGYGVQKKETLSGSVAVVDDKMFKDKGTTSNPLSVLQGQVAGTRITRSSSAPGEEGWNISVRGAVSRNSSGPLVIIDGVSSEGTAELSQLNAADIESMSFLKDASAAIYGAKAAGGVILITTKSAKAGRVKIEYNGSYTHKIVGLQAKLMNFDEWCDGTMQVSLNDGLGTDYTWYRFAEMAKAMKGGWLDLTSGMNPAQPIPGVFGGIDDLVFQDVDWEKALWKNAGSTQHNLSLSGGTDKVTYRLSVGYLNDLSTLRYGNNSNERYNFRLNNTFNLTDRIKINSTITASRRKQVSPTQINAVLSSTPLHPGFPLATLDGKPYNWGEEYGPNWLAELGGDNSLVQNRLSINEQFSYNIFKGLDFTASFGYSTDNSSRDKKYLSIDWYTYNGTPRGSERSPYPKMSDNYYEKSMSRTESYTASAYLSYDKTFGNDHNLKIMAGVQYDRMGYELTGTQASDIQSSLEVLNGSGTIKISGATKYEEAMLSYYSRLNYNWKERYLIEGTLRYDGSSKFQPQNRWDLFYGVSAAWRLTEEPLLKWVKEHVGDLKLRASYGQVGNQSGIDRYDGIQFYDFSSKGGALLDGEKLSYITAGKLVSLERKWERIHNYNYYCPLNVFNLLF